VKVADSCFMYNHTVCCRFPARCLLKGKSNLIAVHAQGIIVNSINTVNKFKDEIVCPLIPTINLAGTWLFATGDNLKWKEKTCNESVFKPILVPKNWDEQGYERYDGFAWYRKTFVNSPQMQDKTLVLVAGKIDDYGEVYINGQKIGGQVIFNNKNSFKSTWDKWVFYTLSGNILSGNNTIAIRVLDQGGRGGIFQGPIGIITMDDYLKFINIK
jgi:hypothetical protein